MTKSSCPECSERKPTDVNKLGHGTPQHLLPLWPFLWVILGFALLNTGCAPLFLRNTAEKQAKPGTVLFQDDFSNPPSGWGLWSREGGLVEYHNGGLRIQVNATQFDFWSVAGKYFGDVQMEVDASKLGGADDNDFGLICRYQDKDNFYMLVISSDGYYGIAKVKGGQYSMIGSDQLQYSDAIKAGQATNHLRADCVGPKIRFYANGQKLLEVTDPDFPKGDIGVLAGAYGVQGVDILFDNVMVKQP